jgi:uncharacterized membrane protein
MRAGARPESLAVLALLAGASAVCVALIVARMLYSGTGQYRFMLWNLLLAWIPLLLAVAIQSLASSPRRSSRLLSVPTALLWLLFFPNAPYLLTDFLHFLEPRGSVPAWYDLLLFGWFAWVGSLLLPAVEIGEEAFVAAGSIVTRDVPAQTVVMGSPAKVVRDVPEDELLENQ